ncbi:MAG: AMP-binding protein [Balneolaceae bacterium]|nr:AMP-binding protein [Balneolaceae bacterium]
MLGRIFHPNQIEIRDENGRNVGLNSSGTIWLKGPQVFDGYLETRRNEQVFDEEGWFNTGDFWTSEHVSALVHRVPQIVSP